MNTAFKLSLPAICCYFPLGVVYGLVFTQYGYPWYFALLFSTFVYAGAMQFLAFTVLLTGSSLLTLSLALIPLCIRHIFYGMTLSERFKNCNPFLKIYLAHGLVDATYLILITGPRFHDEKKDLRYIATLTALIHLSWIIGTLFGTFVDHLFKLPSGLEFLLTAFFAAAATEQMRKKWELKPILIVFSSIVISLVLAPNHLFLAGMGITTVAILALPSKERGVT